MIKPSKEQIDQDVQIRIVGELADRLPESKAREMAAAAGFTRFRRLDIDHPINAFYEIRP